MRIILGGDSAGKPLVDIIEAHLRTRTDVTVVNASDDPGGHEELYAEMAERVVRQVVDGSYDRSILCCGTGLGVSISANKVPGIRAALTHDTYSAERAAKSNNAQVITMGARVIGPELAKAIVDTYLASDFDPASHSKANVDAIDAVDARNRG